MQKLFIGGKWREASSGRRLPVIDPSTGEIYDSIPRGGAADIDAAVRAARAAYEGAWGATTATDRGRLLMKMAGLISARAEELARVEARDTGKPMGQARADIRIDRTLFRILRRRRRQAARPDRAVLAGFNAMVTREPYGVTAAHSALELSRADVRPLRWRPRSPPAMPSC